MTAKQEIKVGDTVQVNDCIEEWCDLRGKEAVVHSLDPFRLRGLDGLVHTDCYLTIKDVSPVQLAEKTLDNLEAGDILIHEGYDRKVIDVLPNSVLLSYTSDHDSADEFYSIPELKKRDFTVKQDTPVDDTVELTIDEIAEKFGIDADKVRVKKD